MPTVHPGIVIAATLLAFVVLIKVQPVPKIQTDLKTS
jgi:hypothetical protein